MELSSYHLKKKLEHIAATPAHHLEVSQKMLMDVKEFPDEHVLPSVFACWITWCMNGLEIGIVNEVSFIC